MLKCLTRSRCFYSGDLSNANDFNAVRIRGIRFESGIDVDGAHITTVSLASNVVTITTSAAHNFVVGDVVWSEFYNSSFSYHGLLTIKTVPSSTTYTATFTHADVSASTSFGWTALENAAIEDNAQNTTIEDVVLRVSGSNRFHDFIVVDNDQSAKITNLETDGSGVRCTSNFCGNLILTRADNGNASVTYVDKSDISLECSGNGILGLSTNSLEVSNSVIQGFAQYGIRYSGGLQPLIVNNVYEEVGSCTNPIYPGSLQAEVGLITGGNVTLLNNRNGTTPGGSLPRFANTGSNQRNYFIVPHSSANGYGPILLAGYATTNNVGTVNVYWPQITGVGSGTVTYDVLLTTGVFGGSLVAPYLGNANSLATGITGSCSNGICTYGDTQGSATSYGIHSQQIAEGLYFWPGSVVRATEADTTAGGLTPGVISMQGVSSPTSAVSQTLPDFVSLACANGSSTWSPVVVTCLQQTDAGAGFYSTVLTQGDGAGNGPAINSKGRLIIEGRNNGNPFNGPFHAITLFDSNPFKTFATPNNRSVADINDIFLGYDHGNSPSAANAALSFGAPASISNYIANLGDGTNWKERLTSTLKVFKVPVQTTAVTFSNLPACNSSGEGEMRAVSDSTVNTWGSAISGAGTNHVLAYCDGTAWAVMAK